MKPKTTKPAVGEEVQVGKIGAGRIENVLPSGAVIVSRSDGGWFFAAQNRTGHWQRTSVPLFDPVNAAALRQMDLDFLQMVVWPEAR